MSTKHLGTPASDNDDLMDKADVTSAINAAAGNGLTSSVGTLNVGAGTGITVDTSNVSVTANYRSIAIPFHIAGTVTTGVKLAEFIFPVAATLVDMRCRLASGSGTTTVRPSKNGGASDGTAQNVTTSSASTAQNVSFAAGDRLTINVTAVGTTPANLSVTMWANIT